MLRMKLQAIWAAMTQVEINSYIAKMPDRINEVYNRGGRPLVD
jgi:hypothetical protein